MHENKYFLLIPGLACWALVATLRQSFVGFFTHSRFLWMESVLWPLGLLLVGADLFLDPSGWIKPLCLLPSFITATIYLLSSFNDIRQTRLARNQKFGVQPGMQVPDFTLPNAENKPVSVADFRGKPLLLLFVRGDWCPGCHIMLRTYERDRHQFQARGVQLLAVGPDPVGVNREMISRLGLNFELLSDEDLSVTQLFGIKNPFVVKGVGMDDGVPLPASFLIDATGIIRYTSRPDRLGEFLDPNTIFGVLQSIDQPATSKQAQTV
jgi:peroxiredoxin